MKFEDAAFLFNCHHSNRGQCRLDFDEAACLWRHISAMDAPHGVEIGRLDGGSTMLLAMAMGSGRLLSIDKQPHGDEKLKRQLAERKLEFVELVRADSSQHRDPGPFDFAFIDGDHSYRGAMLDHLIWGGLVRVGGLIIHHDMAKTRASATQIPDLTRLRNDITAFFGAEVVDEAGSLCVFRKTRAEGQLVVPPSTP